MKMRDYAALAREKAQQEKVRLSHHAQQERLDDNISTEDLVVALKNGREVEAYPDDPRGPSALLAGQDSQGRWIHVVCGNFEQEYLLVITVYLPQSPKWKDSFTRGR
jgi:hypothetical protein